MTKNEIKFKLLYIKYLLTNLPVFPLAKLLFIQKYLKPTKVLFTS
jgi:hypothetical protein